MNYLSRTCEGCDLCEEWLGRVVFDHSDLSVSAKQAFASRIYALGFRCNASGWPDHGKWCGEIAESMNVELDTKGEGKANGAEERSCRRVVLRFALKVQKYAQEKSVPKNVSWYNQRNCFFLYLKR